MNVAEAGPVAHTQQSLSSVHLVQASVRGRRSELSAQMSKLLEESQEVCEQLEAAREEVQRLTARSEHLNNGRALCSRTTTQSDCKGLVLDNISQELQRGRTAGQLVIPSNTLGQGGSDDRLVTAALDELAEQLTHLGTPISITCRTREVSVFEDKEYDVSWSLNRPR